MPHGVTSPGSIPVAIAAFVSAGALSCAPSEQASPPPLLSGITAQASLPSKPATGIRMGQFVAQFESTTLAHVLEAAKAGRIDHRGDAGESRYWLCYTIGAAGAPERMWIVADGEMGGPDHAMTAVIATRLSSGAEPSSACPLLPAALEPVSFDRGIWLNMSEQELRRVLGTPSETRNDWLVYSYLGKTRGKDQRGADPNARDREMDETSMVAAQVAHGLVVTLHASNVTTY